MDGMGFAPVWGGARASASKKRSMGAVDGCSGVGGARASASKKRSAGLGTAARGAVDGCSGMGRCMGIGVEEEEHGERLARG